MLQRCAPDFSTENTLGDGLNFFHKTLNRKKARLENQAKKVEREENLMGEAKSKKIKIKNEIEEIILKRSEAKSNYKEAVEKIKNAAKLAKMEVEKEERRLLSYRVPKYRCYNGPFEISTENGPF